MIATIAFVFCHALFLLVMFVYMLVLMLMGLINTSITMPFVLTAIVGLPCTLLLMWIPRRYTRPFWVICATCLLFSVLIAVLLAYTIGWHWVMGIGLGLAMLAHTSGIRAVLRRLSLQRKEEITLMLARFARIVGLVCFVIAILLPFYFMFFSSITPRANFLQNPLNIAPRFELGIRTLFSGYREVMTTYRFGRYILNSLLLSTATVAITLIPSTLGAYAVTRLRFKGQKILSKSILLIYMFPTIVLAIPLYSVFASLGLRDTLLGLLIVYPAVTIPVSLYMLHNYFQTLPKDIEEAGIVDGCSRVGVIWRITLPLSLPALLAVGLYIFMIAWNEFLFAFMFLDKQSLFTLSRGVVSLNSQEVPRQFLMAGAIIITVPVMCIFFAFERFFTGGLSAGAVKE